MRRVIRWMHFFEDGLIVAVLLFMVLMGVLQIILRNFFGTSLVWIEPFLQNAVLWIGLLGAMIASRRDEHIRIDIASHYLPASVQRWLAVLVDFFTSGICALVAWHSFFFVLGEREFPTSGFAGVPSWVLQAIIPLGFAMIAGRYAILLVLDLLNRRPPMQEPHA
ncbi:MAG: TRAP transporter small permease [Gammaproteobacteria bacterium]|jgi:TRAP-type C4-dicarboxylate transport system permease small subunit|nr:TRAP transporter small permease [Gammaproteobacteria bacterium]MBQ0773107.1 TRAP transporter small permease [Gammaproteobacteria bacterium]